MERTEHFALPSNQRLGFLRLYAHLNDILSNNYDMMHRPLLIFCIGSEFFTGDLLGPFVGTELTDMPNIKIHGNLEHQIHAGNIMQEIASVKEFYGNSIVIAVDACLGDDTEVGNIEIWKGGLQAGLAAGSALPIFGDISIVGIVNSASQPALYALRNTPLARIVNMAKCIGNALALLSHHMGYAPNSRSSIGN